MDSLSVYFPWEEDTRLSSKVKVYSKTPVKKKLVSQSVEKSDILASWNFSFYFYQHIKFVYEKVAQDNIKIFAFEVKG